MTFEDHQEEARRWVRQWSMGQNKPPYTDQDMQTAYLAGKNEGVEQERSENG